MVVFLGYYAAAELSHFVENVPRVLVSAVKWKKFGKTGFKIWSIRKWSFSTRNSGFGWCGCGWLRLATIAKKDKTQDRDAAQEG